ncbi:MAG: phytanoyl-CoA dioxygenase family protein [Gemmatimonadetes bacterium]|nr:phytanoyl-CoA dioxygenase family protein [Gemmatimonadota bacterium]
MSNNSPFIVDKNLGVNMTVEPEDLTQTNADGEAVIAPTQGEKYLFDARGWLLFPGVLSDDDIRDMREHALQVKHDPQSLPEHEQSYLSGPLQKLADHPIVVGFMNEFVAHPHLASPDGYGFRMEASGIRFRSTRTGEVGKFSPHNGNGLFRFAIDSHHYQCIPGKAYSGLTRVVWELAPVQKGKGGTLVVSGSHKAVYAAPESIRDPNSPIWDTYECPAGSLLIFTEAITHSATPWTDETTDRVAIFNLYNTIGAKWSNWHPHPDLLASMPPKRQSLFRDVRCAANRIGGNGRYHGGNLSDVRVK